MVSIHILNSLVTKVWNSREFKSKPTGEAKEVFKHLMLTLHYSLPWWKDQQYVTKKIRLEAITMDVLNEKAVKPSKKRSTKKGKKNRKNA